MYRKLLNFADSSAIFLSIICIIHCLALPIIVIALPALTSLAFFEDEIFHTWLLFAVIPISIFAVLMGYIHHRSWPIVIISTTGIATLVLVAILGHDVFGEVGEIAVSVIGSILVAYGHVKNFKYRNTWRCNQASAQTPV